MDTCPECGFIYDLSDLSATNIELRAGAAAIAQLLVSAATPSIRTTSGIWSPLEYACHVRDVLLVQRERLLLALRTETPAPPPMGRDERAVHDGYAEQHPEDVARQLNDAAALFCHGFGRLSPQETERTLIYNYPEPTERSIAWLAVHTNHEVQHHLGDVQQQVAP